MKNFLRNLTFRSKILSVLLLATILLSSFSLVLITSVGKMNEVSNEIIYSNIPELVWLSHWDEDLKAKEQFVNRSINNEFCCDFIENYEAITRNSLTELYEKYGEVPPSLEKIQREINRLDFLIINNVQGLLDMNDQEAAAHFVNREYIPNLHQIKDEMGAVKNGVFVSLHTHADSFTAIIRDALGMLLLVTILVIALSIYFSYRISENLTYPIENMVKKVDRIANGDYGLTIKEASQVELNLLTTSINEMSVRLKQSFHTIMNDKMYREQILNSMPIGIVTYDQEGTEFSFNTAAKNLLGTEKAVKDLLEKGAPLKGNNVFWEYFQSQEIMQNVKVPFVYGEEKRALLLSKSKLLNERGEVIGRILQFIDITETEELEQKIHQKDKLALLGELAAGAAHEIRNPLAVIDGFLSLMNYSFSDKEKDQYHLPLLKKELERINSIIEEMLLLTKPSAPHFKEVYVEDIINDIVPLMSDLVEYKDISFHVNLHREALTIDEKQMKQVFHNLIRNSVEAMEAKGTITLTSKVIGGWYFIYLKDEGPGIPESVQSSIFDPFLTLKETGTGLGLTIVQRIIENHKGKIELKASSPEEGTTFVISLPRSTVKPATKGA
ncbi:two-component system sensor histidine kinase AtoS [Evansella vedderi]|uniref:histidine kinase n=1 Tax=Evansella vedderi TaxID=38282 RepID=A0ABT9ZZF4_9BACI|nr:ATP-binding protein [Evansella vedderi]MDQ0256622.1 two-component system sensor histidine kinase AtoS [Evansella vedderi]